MARRLERLEAQVGGLQHERLHEVPREGHVHKVPQGQVDDEVGE